MFVGPRYRTYCMSPLWRSEFWGSACIFGQCFTGSALYSDNNEKTLIHKQTDSAAIAAIPVRRESRSMRLNQRQCTKMISFCTRPSYRRCWLLLSVWTVELSCWKENEKRHSLSCNLTGVQIGRQICYIERHSPTDAVVAFLKARRKSNCAEEGSGYTYNQLLYVYTRENSWNSNFKIWVRPQLDRPTVLSPSSILPPPSFHYALSHARKNSSRLAKILLFTFAFLRFLKPA
jgi:hypothetical protein